MRRCAVCDCPLTICVSCRWLVCPQHGVDWNPRRAQLTVELQQLSCGQHKSARFRCPCGSMACQLCIRERLFVQRVDSPKPAPVSADLACAETELW